MYVAANSIWNTAINFRQHKEDGPGVSKKRQEVDKKIEDMAKKRQITKDMQQKKLEQDKEQEEIRLLLKDENVDVLTEDDKVT